MSTNAGVRLDIWLWSASFFKKRKLAKQVIEGGKIAADESAAEPARLGHLDDRLRITCGIERFLIRVVATSAVSNHPHKRPDKH